MPTQIIERAQKQVHQGSSMMFPWMFWVGNNMALFTNVSSNKCAISSKNMNKYLTEVLVINYLALPVWKTCLIGCDFF